MLNSKWGVSVSLIPDFFRTSEIAGKAGHYHSTPAPSSYHVQSEWIDDP